MHYVGIIIIPSDMTGLWQPPKVSSAFTGYVYLMVTHGRIAEQRHGGILSEDLLSRRQSKR